MTADGILRKELLALLEGGNAHMGLEEVLAGFPMEEINTKPPQTPYSFWHFLEHIRITQWDILEFIRDPRHVSPDYPEGYRPRPGELADGKRWRQTTEGIGSDLHELREIIRNPHNDLLAPLPHAPGYTILREILLVADHNAYHIGELAIMRQILGLWPPDNPYLTGRPD